MISGVEESLGSKRSIARLAKIAAAAVGFAMAAGCTTLSDNKRAIEGGLLGCSAGILACKVRGGDDKTCAVACTAGAAAGAAYGHYLDRRQHEIEAAAKAHHVDVAFTPVAVSKESSKDKNGLLAEIHADNMFASGSSTLTPAGRSAVQAIAAVYGKRTDEQGKPVETKLLLTGYTDSTGSPETNARLSLARARSAAKLFVEAGVPANDVYVKGGGSTNPIASNATSRGRAMNRRVQVLEINNVANLVAYSAARSQDRGALALASASAEPQAGGAESSVRPPAPAGISVPGRRSRSRAAERAAAASRGARAPVDFGGAPAVDGDDALWAAIGPRPRSTLWRLSPIATAHAAEPPPPPCYASLPQVSSPLYHFSDNRVVASHTTGAYVPGLYGGGWGSEVNGTTVGFGPVAVLADDAEPVGSPTLLVQRRGRTSSVERYNTDVNVYEGDKGLLYRLYVTQADAPLECFDIVIPKKGRFAASDGYLFYRDRGRWMQAEYRPALVQQK